MREAVENLLNELDYPEAPPEHFTETRSAAVRGRLSAHDGVQPESGTGLDGLLADLPDWERRELVMADLAGTALVIRDGRGFTLDDGVASARDEPMLGLHNRDFVSLWALHRLARYSTDGPIKFEEYIARATRAAWFYGTQLQALESRELGNKLTVLFPTNLTKRPSAERGFQNFAIGTIGRPAGDRIPASGPLFAWKAIDVSPGNGHPTGITKTGWRLIKELDGLSLDLPHEPELMLRFMAFLADVAPGDRWGFDHLLSVVSEGLDREGLVKSYKDVFAHWTASTASSVAQGYVARAREWGLIEPRLVEGRYWLTDVGRQVAQEVN
jgi:hypothetical protein